MNRELEARVATALGQIQNERLGADVVSAGMVQNLIVSDGGAVSFTFVLSRDDPPTLVRTVKRAVKEIDGVTDLKLRITEPKPPPPDGDAVPASGRRSAPQPESLEELGKVIAVSSGKGGVGKSTVTANVAAALAAQGHRVGLLDADVYGPNIPRMFGVGGKPVVNERRKIVPHEAFGVRLMSLGFMIERDQAAIWRGPIITKILQQFLRDVEWGELDYLLVDLPPGTGDAQLSLVQSVQVQSAIIVTTPQKMATGDGLRGAKMFEKVNVPVMGVVENMSYLICGECGHRTEIFRSGGGEQLAAELEVPLLGQVPLDPEVVDLADRGQPAVIAKPDSDVARALVGIAEEVVSRAGGLSVSLPVVQN